MRCYNPEDRTLNEYVLFSCDVNKDASSGLDYIASSDKTKTKLRGFRPRANHADRATAAY
jgi:hypothetical protein